MVCEISIVIPVYRAEQTLGLLCDVIQSELKTLERTFEIIFVEDCGGDNSWAVIKSLCKKFDNVKGIRLSRNAGQHNALLCGIRNASGELIITMDDDLQNPPDQIHLLLNKIDEGYDVVYGYPNVETHGFFRDMSSKLTKKLLKGIVGVPSAERASAFRKFRKKLTESFSSFNDPYANIDVLLTWGTTNFSDVAVAQNKRSEGVSGYSFLKLVKHFVNMLTGYSVVPLKVASILGVAFGFVGFIALVYVCAMVLIHGRQVPGFAFVASLVSIFSGVQLLCLGVMGEYLARMYHRSMGKPSFYIAEFGGNNGISE